MSGSADQRSADQRRLRTVGVKEPCDGARALSMTKPSCTKSFARTLHSRPRMTKPLVNLLHLAIYGVLDLVKERHAVRSVSRTEAAAPVEMLLRLYISKGGRDMQIQMIMGTPPRLLKREIGVGGQQRRLRLRQPPLDEIILALAAKSDLHSEDIGALVEGHGDELLGHVRQHASGGGEEEFERPLLDVASTRKVLRNPEPREMHISFRPARPIQGSLMK